jgi:WD40 repeat protein
MNAVVHGAYSFQGDRIATCDLDGALKLWDVRHNTELQGFSFNVPAEKIAFDIKGDLIATALSDGSCQMYSFILFFILGMTCWMIKLLMSTRVRRLVYRLLILILWVNPLLLRVMTELFKSGLNKTLRITFIRYI